MIEAVLFDFDGLLLDTETPEYHSWREVFEAHGHLLAPQTWAANTGKGAGAIAFSPYDALEALLDRTIDRDAIRVARRKRFAELMAAQDLLPGAAARLQEARQLGLKIGLVSSSSREWITGYLSRFGLTDSFDLILCGDDVRHTKPDPELYLAALAAFGLRGEQALALEDSTHGIAAAKAAGIFCVAVPNPLTKHACLDAADLILTSLADVTLQELIQ